MAIRNLKLILGTIQHVESLILKWNNFFFFHEILKVLRALRLYLERSCQLLSVRRKLFRVSSGYTGRWPVYEYIIYRSYRYSTQKMTIYMYLININSAVSNERTRLKYIIILSCRRATRHAVQLWAIIIASLVIFQLLLFKGSESPQLWDPQKRSFFIRPKFTHILLAIVQTLFAQTGVLEFSSLLPINK